MRTRMYSSLHEFKGRICESKSEFGLASTRTIQLSRTRLRTHTRLKRQSVRLLASAATLNLNLNSILKPKAITSLSV